MIAHFLSSLSVSLSNEIEMKFESFPALIEAIMNDKANAKDALDISYFQEQREESFLSDLNAVWIGTSGGDKHSSYQFGS